MQKLTTGEVARRLGMSVSTVRNLIAQGELKAERRNTTSQYRILSTELDRYARERGLTLLNETGVVEIEKSDLIPG
ncbi:MAG: helix-turn-helix domain-containing protein [Caldilineaceae bacterium]